MYKCFCLYLSQEIVFPTCKFNRTKMQSKHIQRQHDKEMNKQNQRQQFLCYI